MAKEFNLVRVLHEEGSRQSERDTLVSITACSAVFTRNKDDDLGK